MLLLFFQGQTLDSVDAELPKSGQETPSTSIQTLGATSQDIQSKAFHLLTQRSIFLLFLKFYKTKI